MRQFLSGIVAICLSAASGAVAAEVAPGDVKFEENAVKASLTGVPGNPDEGEKVLVSRSLGNCLACHAVTALADQEFHGDVGPTLDAVADRWTVEEIRALVIDAKKINEDTMMPGFYSLDVGINVREDLVGKTILTAQQVEDVVAYLATLKGSD